MQRLPNTVLQQKRIHHFVAIIVLLCILVACTKPVDVSERMAHWQTVLELRFENEQTPDQLKDWLEGINVVNVRYNNQGDLVAILEVVPGDGEEFREHLIMLAVNIISGDELGSFYIFIANQRP
jgi:hypothetical protein